MGNNQNQIIKQALEILSENNRFALKSITNDSAIKTNFYKLSDVDLRADLKDDIKDIGKDPEFIPIKTFEELEREKDPSPDPDPKPERKDSNKYKRPTHTGLFAYLEKLSLDGQANAIFDLDFKYAAKEFGLSKSEMRSMKQEEKDNFMRSLGLKTLKEILEMDPEQRAKHMGVEYNDRLRMPSSRILNLNLGKNR